MYNRYIPSGGTYTRVTEDDGPPLTPPPSYGRFPPEFPGGPEEPPEGPPPEKTVQAEAPPPEPPPPAAPPPKQAAGLSGLSSLLKGLKLDSLDIGDLLLLCILLFLFLEGDDTELLIALGLLLVLGLE